MKAILFILIGLFGIHIILAQAPNPDSILQGALSEIDKIKSYEVDVEIQVDVDFINMPNKRAKMFYKHPDKVKFKSDEFIMIPQKGIKNGVHKLLSEPYASIYVGEEILDQSNYHVIKIIPMGKKPDVILATVWLDKKTLLVGKTESSTRNQGTYIVEFRHSEPNHNLPSEMIISFEIENLKIPLKFIGKAQGIDIDSDKAKGKQEGKVYIKFTNYIINQEMDNSIFEENRIE